ncbi:unnamed protein product [Pseudo-nitzschia multistriata]|uniref:S-adenosyl-L-methionine-dependent methyltransferase n=1 Tax=Pseudo-nitzschia multistriata TaxID=183589 RepID=A0A448ZRZ9_9STRA|nr:unnamed protein product [Pseudo-nitzschia multistriata]
MMFIVIIFGFGIKFLEEYCSILPPPTRLDDEKGKKARRPAVYLLKIPFGLFTSCLLLPNLVAVYIPNYIRAANTMLMSNANFEGEDLRVILPPDEFSRVCYREEMGFLIQCTLTAAEILAFHFDLPNVVWAHHIVAMSLALGRLYAWCYPITLMSDWLWLAVVVHLTIYSLNFVRSCYSFLRHFLTREDNLSGIPTMKHLFHCTNVGSWKIIVSAYAFSSVVAVLSDGGKTEQALLCLAFVAPLFYGSFQEMRRWRSSSISDGFPTRMFVQVTVEIMVGLFLGPILLFLDFLFPHAMKKFSKKTSHKNTAGGVVALRALCNASSDSRLHIDDPYAIRFVQRGVLHIVVKSAVLRYLMTLKLEVQHPGALGHLITRTKTIDEIILDLTSRKNKPVRQLVILGAGYDTRAYRLKSLKDVLVLEVDQPFMSSEKQEKCADLKPLCKELVHLSTDFNKESVADVMNGCDKFDPKKPTLFLWEGVQVYLSDDSVDKMFASLCTLGQKLLDPAHYLYFTFSDKKLMTPEGRKSIYGGEEFFEYAGGIGEKVESGIDPNGIKDYLLTRGFDIYNYSPRSGLSGHMTPSQKQDMYLSNHPFIVQSEVFHSGLIKNVALWTDSKIVS